MTDIHEFLTARLDEDETHARDAMRQTTGTWRLDPYDAGANSVDLGFKPVQVPSAVRGKPRFKSVTLDGTVFVRDRGVAAHIARWDPARVLAEVEAKQRIVQLHAPGKYGECRTCDIGGAESCGCVGIGEYPCDTLKLIAATYADHPDFDPSWTATAEEKT